MGGQSDLKFEGGCRSSLRTPFFTALFGRFEAVHGKSESPLSTFDFQLSTFNFQPLLATIQPPMDDPALPELIRQVRLVLFDFDGVFTDNAVYVSEDGSESVRCWRGDGIGLRKLEALGIAIRVISTETNPVVEARCRKLRVDCSSGVKDKRAALEALRREMGLELAQIAFMGNDVNDLECLASVGLPIVVSDAHRDVVSLARYRTSAPGGHGAVREVCDLFERIRGRGGRA